MDKNSTSSLREVRAKSLDDHHLISELVHNMAAVAYIFDCQTQETEILGNRANEILGYDSAQWKTLLRSGFAKALMHPDDFEKLPAHFASLAQQPPQQNRREFEYRIRHSDGTWRWFLSKDVIYARDNENNVQKILGTAIEIGDRKATEASLEYTGATFRHLRGSGRSHLRRRA